MCCGQKRQGISTSRQDTAVGRAQTQGAAAPVAASAPRDAGTGSNVTLVARDGSILSVFGRVTGRRYQFHRAGGMQVVDRRDAEALIATGAFERV